MYVQTLNVWQVGFPEVHQGIPIFEVVGTHVHGSKAGALTETLQLLHVFELVGCQIQGVQHA